MSPSRNSFYSTWRQSCRAFSAFRESDAPPERLLQNVWHHQRIRRDELRLLDGRALRVLHPGFWNHGAGPDFRDAVLQFDSDAPFTCDVEIDLEASGWRAHGHDRNPSFTTVKLHVVWDAQRQSEFPTLVLKKFLDSPLPEIALWLGSEAGQRFPDELLGQCASPLRDLSDEQLEVLLNEAAIVRLQSKAAELHARARQCGWEQTLWEGLLRALGYKNNVWPMQRIGELRARLCDGTRDDQLQSRLLGVSGLLPTEVSRGRSASDVYLRNVWDSWWRERDAFNDCVLPKSLWRLNGLRPANHPQRRLALAAHWWADNKLVSRIEKWFTASHEKNELAPSLLEALQVPKDDFWSWHWTIRSARMKSAQPLLGATRVTDLAVNVILPWLWVRAREGQNTKLQSLVEAHYFAWPAAEDNAVLRLARNRLLGGRSIAKLRSAAMQQGLMQVVYDFCDHANALCADCKFPELVRNYFVAATRD